MEGLYPDRFDFEYISSEYLSGQDSTVQAGIAHTDLSGKYNREDPVVCFVVRDDEGHRFRMMMPSDIDYMLNGLRETRDTLNNCNLCFNSISNYKGSISDFELMVEMRAFDGGVTDEFDLSVQSVKNCKKCQIGLETALQDVIDEVSDILVASTV